MIRCRNLVCELLAGITPDSTELTRQVAGVYVFLFRLLTNAQIRRDRDAIQKTIEILAVEQETWRMVCEQMPTAPIPRPGQNETAREITAAQAELLLAAQADAAGSSDPPTTVRFMLDA